jgi:hypothetical protein
MSGDHQKSCEERIDGELASTERCYSKLWRQFDHAIKRGADTAEEAWEEMAPLSLEMKRVLKLMFSWGGPSDWLEAELDGCSVVSLTYHRVEGRFQAGALRPTGIVNIDLTP